jgi:hypothetical protein
MTFVIFNSDSRHASGRSALEGGLEDALHRELSVNAGGMPALANYDLQIVQGDRMPAAVAVAESISVYLHGDCAAPPIAFLEGHAPAGVLGWVVRRQGKVEPFIHVDCSHILQLLTPRLMALNREQRRYAMSVAIARVILHEWIHIESQSPRHVERGLTKSSFTPQDLMPDLDQMIAQSPSVSRASRGSQMR